MNDTPSQPAPAEPQRALPPPSGPDPRPNTRSSPGALLSAIAIVLAALVLGFLVWQWYVTRSTVETLRQEVARKLAEGEVTNKAGRTLAEQTREAVSEVQVKLGVLESRLAESQGQQIALESLYQDLSRNRDDWAFADVEQSLLIASQQLQLAGNVKAALIALENADARLQRMERPQLTPLRKAIHRDLERLKALPHVDTVGVSVKLDNLIGAVEKLPLAMEVRPPAPPPAPDAAGAEPNAWRRFLEEAWTELKQLVRIQHMDRREIPLLTPEQSFFLRENLKLRLLAARLALLARDEASFKSDLQAARDWIVRYYDTREKSVAAALSTLRNLQQSDINIVTPEIAATLDALRNLRIARDRPAR